LLQRQTSLYEFVVNTADAYDDSLNGLQEFAHFPMLLDAVRLLKRSSFLTNSEADTLRLWAAKTFDFFTSGQFEPSTQRPLYLRTFLDVSMISLAAYSDDATGFLFIVSRASHRLQLILKQMKYLVKRKRIYAVQEKTLNHIHSIQTFVDLMNIAGRANIHVWDREARHIGVEAAEMSFFCARKQCIISMTVRQLFHRFSAWVKKTIFMEDAPSIIRLRLLALYRSIHSEEEFLHFTELWQAVSLELKKSWNSDRSVLGFDALRFMIQ
jgi:hypothetical protein